MSTLKKIIVIFIFLINYKPLLNFNNVDKLIKIVLHSTQKKTSAQTSICIGSIRHIYPLTSEGAISSTYRWAARDLSSSRRSALELRQDDPHDRCYDIFVVTFKCDANDEITIVNFLWTRHQV